MERWSTHIYYNYLHSSTYTGYRYSLENRVLGRVLKTGFGRVLKTGFGEDSEIGFTETGWKTGFHISPPFSLCAPERLVDSQTRSSNVVTQRTAAVSLRVPKDMPAAGAGDHKTSRHARKRSLI